MGQKERETAKEVRGLYGGRAATLPEERRRDAWTGAGKDLAEAKEGRDRVLGRLPRPQVPHAVLAILCLCGCHFWALCLSALPHPSDRQVVQASLLVGRLPLCSP